MGWMSSAFRFCRGEIFESAPTPDYIPSVHFLAGRSIITRSGVILKNWDSFRKTTYGGLNLKFKIFRISIISLMLRRISVVDDNRIVFIHSIWSRGYYHWITESLVRAYIVRLANPTLTPVLPLSHKSYEESLALLGFANIQYFPEGRNIIAQKFYFTDCPGKFPSTDPQVLKEMCEELILRAERHLQSVDRDRDAERKITFISRRKARGRYIINEPEVENLIRELGGRCVVLEDLTFSEQIMLMQNTSILVGLHGAGLTNALFLKPGSGMIEILPKRNGIWDFSTTRKSFLHDPCYVAVSEVADVKYSFIQCDSDVSFFGKTHWSNVYVDTDSLRRSITGLVSRCE